MKLSFWFFILLAPLVYADQKVNVTVDGMKYDCSAGGVGGGIDPACVKKVSDYCNNETAYTSSVCFGKATEGCRAAVTAEFAACVIDMAKYCNEETSFTSSICFDKALSACQGTRAGILGFVQSFVEPRKK